MTSARKTESYRGFDLVADAEQAKGVAWKKGSDRFEAQGKEVDGLLKALREQIDLAFPRVAVDMTTESVRDPGLASAYQEAFSRVVAQKGVAESYLAMLRGVARAPGHQMSDYEHQDAAGYQNVNGVNLHSERWVSRSTTL